MKITQKNNNTVVKIKKDEIDKIDFAHCAEPRETLASFYNRQTVKPDILSNGGFFAMSTGQPVFNFKDENQIAANDTTHRWGMGIVGDNELEYGCVDYSPNFRDFISGHPILLDNGHKCSYDYASELNYNARRTVLGYDDNYIYLIAVEGSGMHFPVLQDYLLSLGVKYAINLDGGGSTKILKNGKCITSAVYNRAVDNVVAIYLKKSDGSGTTNTATEKIIYRVQCGAFSSKNNAEKLRDQIRALDDTIGAGYKNAYVRQVAGLWKVQIGAYSVKANAERVKNDLKDKGLNAFVTTD